MKNTMTIAAVLLVLGACATNEEGPDVCSTNPSSAACGGDSSLDELSSARHSTRLQAHIEALEATGWTVGELSEKSIERVAVAGDREVGIVSLLASKRRADGKVLEVDIRFAREAPADTSVALRPHDEDASAELQANPPRIDAEEAEPANVLGATGVVLAATNRCSSRVISWPNTSFACVALWSNPAGVFRRWQTFCDGGTGQLAYIAAWDGCAATVPWGGGSTRWIECNPAKPNKCGTP